MHGNRQTPTARTDGRDGHGRAGTTSTPAPPDLTEGPPALSHCHQPLPLSPSSLTLLGSSFSHLRNEKGNPEATALTGQSLCGPLCGFGKAFCLDSLDLCGWDGVYCRQVGLTLSCLL